MEDMALLLTTACLLVLGLLVGGGGCYSSRVSSAFLDREREEGMPVAFGDQR